MMKKNKEIGEGRKRVRDTKETYCKYWITMTKVLVIIVYNFLLIWDDSLNDEGVSHKIFTTNINKFHNKMD